MQPQLLTAYQNAHFARASKARVWMVCIQLLVTFVGALSVLIAPEHVLYYLAILGAALTIIWWLLKRYYDGMRDAAQSARRAGLIANGLEGKISPAVLRDLQLGFRVDETEATKFIKQDYYETTAAPSWERLAEMLEESAFYTSKLQEDSASAVRWFVGISTAICIVAVFLVVGQNDATFEINIARIALSFILFVLTGDILGSLWLHTSAARKAEKVCQRLASRRDRTTNDILLCLLDYDAIVESAPEVLPYIYEIRRTRLDELWRSYQETRSEQAK